MVPEGYQEQQLGIVNRRADDEATAQLKAMLRSTSILEWRNKYKRCRDWSNEAVSWATAKCRFFHHHVAKAEGVTDPAALDDGLSHPVVCRTAEHRAWIQDVESLFPIMASASGEIGFTPASPCHNATAPPDFHLMRSPLPAGGADAVRAPVDGATLGAAVDHQKDMTLSRTPSRDDGRRPAGRSQASDPFSEEGDHEWLLHEEVEGLFTQRADDDFFNDYSLIL